MNAMGSTVVGQDKYNNKNIIVYIKKNILLLLVLYNSVPRVDRKKK